MPPPSFPPWKPSAPLAGLSVVSTPSGRLSAVDPRPYSTQCVKVPPGASGSSMTSANAFVSAGAPSQASGGETLSPSQVYSAGIVSSLPNASLTSEKAVASPPKGVSRVEGVCPAEGVSDGALSPPQQAARSASHTPSANRIDAFTQIRRTLIARPPAPDLSPP